MAVWVAPEALAVWVVLAMMAPLAAQALLAQLVVALWVGKMLPAYRARPVVRALVVQQVMQAR